VKLRLVIVFPDIVKDCPKMRNLSTIFLRSFKNVGPELSEQLSNFCTLSLHFTHRNVNESATST